MWTSGFFTKGDEIGQWEATALQNGWYVIVTNTRGKVGEYQGATFNLPLEIAAAARRLM
jgi:hypothetical protein